MCIVFSWLWPKTSPNQWKIGVNAYIWQSQLITPWTLRKRVPEGSAPKLNNIGIWMPLSQKNSAVYIWDAQGLPTSMYTQKGRRPYLYSLTSQQYSLL